MNNRETERGRKFLEAAYAGKAKRADALIELARLRFADAEEKPAGPGGKFSPSQVAEIIGPLTLGRGQPPPQLALYEIAGEANA
jgi:hypothetical protein